MSEYCVFTIAHGQSRFKRMAYALCRSYRLHNRSDEVPFYLYTDTPENMPRDLDWVITKVFSQEKYGKGFIPKLHLDKLAPTRIALFIDADCLCVGDIRPFFERFSGLPVGTIGQMIYEGNFFGDVCHIRKTYDVEGLPWFNGGVYYLETGPVCDHTFNTARQVADQYDELRLIRLRGYPNDEIAISIGMALNDIKPLEDKGDLMNTPLAAPAGIEVDVFSGTSLLKNSEDHPKHDSRYPVLLRPIIVHFAGYPIDRVPYASEMKKLELHCHDGLPRPLAGMIVMTKIQLPQFLIYRLKNLLRPIFHFFFGPRKVKSTRAFDED